MMVRSWFIRCLRWRYGYTLEQRRLRHEMAVRGFGRLWPSWPLFTCNLTVASTWLGTMKEQLFPC